MQLCYLDEAGDTLPVPVGGSQTISSVFVFGGISFSADVLPQVTREFVEIKASNFPATNVRHEHDYLKAILPEIKGAQLRRAFRREADPMDTARAASVLDGVLSLLKRNKAKVVARVRKKGDSEGAIGEPVYLQAVEQVCKSFNDRLASEGDFGVVIADNRNPGQNAQVSHAIYVEKFRGSDKLPRIIDTPTFGQSENHAGIQIADIICSALLYPMASGDATIRQRFGHRVDALHRDYTTDGYGSYEGLRIFDMKGRPISPHDVLGI